MPILATHKTLPDINVAGHPANVISISAISGINGNTVQSAIQEVNTKLSNVANTTIELTGNIQTVKNVAIMQAMTLNVGQLIRTSCYTTPGDGGEVIYEIISANTVVGYDEPNIQQFNQMPYWSAGAYGFRNANWGVSGVGATFVGYASGTTLIVNSISTGIITVGGYLHFSDATVTAQVSGTPGGIGVYTLSVSTSKGTDLAPVTMYIGFKHNIATAPDGKSAIEFIIENTSNTAHYYYLNQPANAGNAVTVNLNPQEWVFYAGKYPALSTRQFMRAGLTSGSRVAANQASCVVDLSNGTVASSTYGSNLLNAKTLVLDVGDYWLVRMQFTPTMIQYFDVSFSIYQSATVGTYVGDGVSGIAVGGYSLRPLVTPIIVLNNNLQAKPLTGSVVRLSQFGATAASDNNAILKTLCLYGTSVLGTILVDIPTTFAQPTSLVTLIIPSNINLKFEGAGSIKGITNMKINSSVIAENRAILPKYASVTFGPTQSSVKSNWFGVL